MDMPFVTHHGSSPLGQQLGEVDIEEGARDLNLAIDHVDEGAPADNNNDHQDSLEDNVEAPASNSQENHQAKVEVDEYEDTANDHNLEEDPAKHHWEDHQDTLEENEDAPAVDDKRTHQDRLEEALAVDAAADHLEEGLAEDAPAEHEDSHHDQLAEDVAEDAAAVDEGGPCNSHTYDNLCDHLVLAFAGGAAAVDITLGRRQTRCCPCGRSKANCRKPTKPGIGAMTDNDTAGAIIPRACGVQHTGAEATWRMGGGGGTDCPLPLL